MRICNKTFINKLVTGKKIFSVLVSYMLLWCCFSCADAAHEPKAKAERNTVKKGSFAYDANFLKKYNRSVITLQDSSRGAQVLISGDYQGRVITSTATGDTGSSYGWINYKLISSGKPVKQFNPVGGEERFWLGPEGGQYGLYFKAGDSFNISHWQVPAVIDTDSFQVSAFSKTQVSFLKKAMITNYSGNSFEVKINRTISLVTRKDLEERLKLKIPPALNFVAYKTTNQLTNTGQQDWTRENGLLSIWLLGMFTPSDQTTVIIPFRPIPNATSFITKNYFGEIPPERLKIKDSALYFTCDGKFRSKIGLSPLIAKPVAASFDSKKNVLTLILFSVDKNAAYVNSKWEEQKQPYKGDVVNSYNDGPMADGSQMGPFYEIESSSPAIALKKDAQASYSQVTCHFEGSYEQLNAIAKQLFGVDLDGLKK